MAIRFGTNLPRPIPPEALRAKERHKARELVREQQQGLGKPIIQTVFKDCQFVAEGHKLHHSKNWKFFTYLLMNYIKNILVTEWHASASAKLPEARHPILHWLDNIAKYQAKQKPRPDGTYVAPLIGANPWRGNRTT